MESVLLLAKAVDSTWTGFMESRYLQNAQAVSSSWNPCFRVKVKVTLGFCLTPEYLDFIVGRETSK